jgi:hypothetical protein
MRWLVPKFDMSEDKNPNVASIELHEEFIQHMERGGRKIQILALIATLAGAYFSVVYFLQLFILPYVLGITTQTVNLVDPSLMGLEVISLLIALLWFYAGLRDLAFQSNMAKRIREIRALQRQLAAKYDLK